MFANKIPEKIYGIRTEQAVYDQLSTEPRTINHELGELNQKKHLLDWALSYDIEYGRYVPEEGKDKYSYSSCEVVQGYLNNIECQDADYSGWITKTDSTFFFDEYGYPLSSGMIGWRYILKLSEDYGIPTTQYLVTKDVDFFKKKDSKLFELSEKLVKEGLIEIGSHTRYHTHLGKVDKEIAKRELLLSKQELEKLYNITITGVRTPYLSLIENDISQTEKIISEVSYDYYSMYGNHYTATYSNKNIEHKPINFYGYLGYATFGHLENALLNLNNIISLDHPWNIQFKETEKEGGIILREAPQQQLLKKAIILAAMSQGTWFKTVDSLNYLK